MYGDATKPVAGIKSFKKEDLPPINIVFQTYHLMITIGVFLFVLTIICCVYLWRGKLFETTWLLKILGPGSSFAADSQSIGMDDRGDRTPAMDRLWIAAYQRRACPRRSRPMLS